MCPKGFTCVVFLVRKAIHFDETVDLSFYLVVQWNVGCTYDKQKNADTGISLYNLYMRAKASIESTIYSVYD